MSRQSVEQPQLTEAGLHWSLQKWVKTLDTLSPHEAGKIVNKEKFLELLEIAALEKKPIVFVAIGCPDWTKPSWGLDQQRLISDIDTSNKRAQRFAQELAQFQRALHSFGVPHRIHFTLSNVELAMHVALNNMGQEILTHQPLESNAQSIANLTTLINNQGGQIELFDHLERIYQLLGENDINILQTYIAGKQNPTYRELLDSLYSLDQTVVIPSFLEEDDAGLVVLDIQTFNFTYDVDFFRASAATKMPKVPIIAPFANSGNWHASQQPISLVPSRDEILGELLNLKEDSNWFQTLLQLPDEYVQHLLRNFGKDIVDINSADDKNQAVQSLWQAMFALPPRKEVSIPELNLAKDTKLLDAVRTANANLNRKSAIHLIESGSIRVNGAVVKNLFQSLEAVSELQIGKKVYSVNFE